MQRKAEYQENALSSKAAATIGSDAPMKNDVRSITNTESSATGTRQAFVPLSFKVTKSFKKRYQQAALDADMKLNELLSAMLDQWEEKRSINKVRKT
jgi:hypothetical protein